MEEPAGLPKEAQELRVDEPTTEAPMHREAATVLFRSTFVRLATLAALIALGLLVPSAAQADGCANANLRPTRGNLEVVRSAVLCLHNAERARHGLPQLSENPRLRRAAERHSSHMVDAHFFDHTTPAGATMVDRIRRTGYTSGARGWSLGENIAWGTGRLATAAQIHRSWMRSPGHRANILQRAFREIGIGIGAGVPVRLSASQSGATYTTDFGFRR
jgi:uncharacterized protein YkwD